MRIGYISEEYVPQNYLGRTIPFFIGGTALHHEALPPPFMFDFEIAHHIRGDRLAPQEILCARTQVHKLCPPPFTL